MRIAMVYDVIYPYVVGGVQLRNWELARRLVKRGHEVTLFGMKHWSGPDTITRQGVRLVGVCPSKELYVRGRRAFWPPMLVALSTMRPLLSQRFDVVDVANFPYFPFFAVKVAQASQRPGLVVTWYEVWGRYWRDYLGHAGAIAQVIEKFCARLTTNAVTLSEMTKRDLLQVGYHRRVDVIPGGVDVRRASEAPVSEQSSDVIFFGRLIKEKNVDLLIRALVPIARETPDLRCVVVGDGPERENVANQIALAHLGANVSMIPFVDSREEVFARMKSSKVLVLPSCREGFGIAAVEANACGLPIITTNYPRNACRELVQNGQNGFVCEPNEHDLTDRIRLILEGSGPSPSDCLRAAERYDWDDLAGVVERYYQTVAA